MATPKTVLVTGAGFSKAWGYPLTSQLTARMRQEAEWTPPPENTDRQYFTVGILEGFLKRIPSNHVYETNFERLLTDVFSGIADGRRLEDSVDLDLEGLETAEIGIVSEMLIYGLGMVLSRIKRGVGIDADAFFQRRAPGMRAEWLFRQVEPSLTPFALVTVNYDLVPEEDLFRQLQFDYSLGHEAQLATKYVPQTLPPHDMPYAMVEHGPLPAGGGSVLKLHGSHNWAYCADCLMPIVFPERIPFDAASRTFDLENLLFATMAWENTTGYRYSFHQHPDGLTPAMSSAHRLHPLMIPPLENKNELREWRLLAPVWESAREMLAVCDQLLVVGCSIRDADTDLHELLALAHGKPAYMVGGQNDGAQERLEHLVGAVTYLGDDMWTDEVIEKLKNL